MSKLKIGYEVAFHDDPTYKFVITRFSKDKKYISGIGHDGRVFCYKLTDNWVPTGKYFYEVDHLLSVLQAEKEKDECKGRETDD